MKKIYLLLSLFALAQMSPFVIIAQPPTDLVLLDDFSDKDYTANPEWTVIDSSGKWDIFNISNQRQHTLRTNMGSSVNPKGFSALYTPFSKACDAWQIDFLPATCPSTPIGRKMEYYFLMTSASNDPRKASGYKLSYHFAILEGTTRKNILYLQKVENGATVSTIASYNNGSFCSLSRITVTRIDSTWNLYVGNTLRGSGIDISYSPSESAYQSISVSDSILTSFSDQYRFDNLRYREAVSTSLQKDPKINSLKLKSFPNPAADRLQVSFESIKTERGEIRLIDMQGRLIYSKPIFMNNGMNLFDLNLKERNIGAGTYILKLKAGSNEQLNKVVVQ